MRAAALGAVLLIASCSTPREQVEYAQEGRDFTFAVVENSSKQRFDLEISSVSPRLLCVDSYNWPSAIGGMHFAQDHVFVESGTEQYPIRVGNYGYPVGDTYVRLNTGQKHTGFIAFDQFDSAAFASEAPRRLIMSAPPVVFCHPGSNR